MSTSGTLLTNAIAIGALMTLTWLVSLVKHNASIVDIVWGFGFVVVGWTSWAVTDTTGARSTVLLTMVTLWGLRLAGYLWWRNHGAGEDFRYAAMRRRIGSRFGLVSFVTVFVTQGALMFVVSLPLPFGMQTDHQERVDLLTAVGVAVWAVGLCFEALGDAQLARFKSDPANAGAVMDRGLWRYTRHPNYFGDFCVWWGIFAVGARSWPAVVSVIGPLTMSVLLLRVSGVTLLEKSLTKRRPGYAEYVSRTSAFFPRPPRGQ